MSRIVAVILVGLAVVAPAAAKTKPKPWAWTTAQAGQHVDGTCRGVGKAVAKHWVAFSCTTDEQRVWVKVRPRGKGGACVSGKSLATVNPLCLTARGLVARGNQDGPDEQIKDATTARFEPGSKIPWQSFTDLDCLGADGFYECSFASDVTGTALVMYRPGGATVKFTSLACTGAYAGRAECAT